MKSESDQIKFKYNECLNNNKKLECKCNKIKNENNNNNNNHKNNKIMLIEQLNNIKKDMNKIIENNKIDNALKDNVGSLA